MSDTIESNIAGGAAQTEQPIMVVIEHRPEIVLLDDGKRDALFAFIEAEVESFEPDVTTAKGRDAIKALAFKITRTKTAVEAARLRLTEEWREKIKAVNAGGTPIKEKLEALAKSARAPLTEWEEAEEKRETKCKTILDELRAAAIVPMGVSSEMLRERIGEIEREDMSEELWAGMLSLAETARDTALQALRAALERVGQEEKDRAELAILRTQAEAAEKEKLAREREANEAAAAEQRRKDEAEQAARAEADAAASTERTRIATEQAATAAAERARAEEAERAEQQAAERQRAHEAELQAERDRANEIARKAEEERIARAEEQRQRIAAEEAAAAERARLEADQARRTAAKREAKEALMTIDGITEAQAKAIVLLIISGEVPRVILDFAAEPKVRPASPVPGVGQGAGDKAERTLV